MPERKRRLFFALWPDETVRKALDHGARELTGKRVRRVPADRLHITLAFAGPVSAGVQDCLERRAAAIRLAPFRLVIDHAGYYPRPRVLWIGPADMPPGLWSLAGALRSALVECGMPPEKRAFQAHVTVARKYSQGVPEQTFEAIDWPVSEFRLVESVGTENGVIYQPLRAWPLEGG